MKRAIGVLAGLLVTTSGLRGQMMKPAAQLNWQTVHVVILSDSTTGVKVFLITDASKSVPYLFYQQSFVPAETVTWIQSAEGLLARPDSSPARQVILVARDSSLLILARNKAEHGQLVLAYYAPPDAAETKPLAINVSPPAAQAFLDSLRAGALAAGYDPSVPLPDTAVLNAEAIQQKPRFAGGPPPEYPLEQGRPREGTVIVQAVVDTLGKVERGSIKVISSPDPAFSASVMSMIRQTRFIPARVNGRPRRVMIQIPVVFTLTHH